MREKEGGREREVRREGERGKEGGSGHMHVHKCTCRSIY